MSVIVLEILNKPLAPLSAILVESPSSITYHRMGEHIYAEGDTNTIHKKTLNALSAFALLGD